jgi:hypothetical protein
MVKKEVKVDQVKIFRFYFLLAILVAFDGCSLFEEDNKLPIEGNIICRCGEGYDKENGKPRISMFCRTEDSNMCADNRIMTKIDVSNNKIAIDFLYIYHPDGICYQWIGPATYDTFVDIQEGTYELYFTYKKIKDEYVLDISDSSIEIKPVVSTLTDVSPDVLWRYPENSFICYSFASSGENGSMDSLLFSYFADSLSTNALFEEYEFPDYGEIPYLRGNLGDYKILARYYTYRDESDFNKAAAILDAYIDKLSSDSAKGFRISLRNWMNRHYSFEVVNSQ